MPPLPRPAILLPAVVLALAAWGCQGEADDDDTGDDDTTPTDDDTTPADDDTTPADDDTSDDDTSDDDTSDDDTSDDDTSPPAPEIWLGAFDSTRSGEAAIADGSLFGTLREVLLTGLSQPVGVRGNSVLSEAFVGTVDGLVISLHTAGDVAPQPLEDSELHQLEEFVRSGKPVVLLTDSNATADLDDLNDDLLVSFGITTDFSLSGEQYAFVSAPDAHVLTSDPNRLTTFTQYDPGPFEFLGPATFLAAMQGAPGYAGAVLDPGVWASGAGALVFFADLNTFIDEANALGVPGYALESADLIENVGEYLLANLGS
ncbi:MAG: hypothetical protein HUU15_05680 [Candidatus Brocadiae bacterium]|nr:hypothetical protein [Myxococcota bacterium]NUN48304.1 hypothetical protein [Candidatus Brocadiia bacterium]